MTAHRPSSFRLLAAAIAVAALVAGGLLLRRPGVGATAPPPPAAASPAAVQRANDAHASATPLAAPNVRMVRPPRSSPDRAQESVRVFGRVTDTHTQSPIAGADIIAFLDSTFAPSGNVATVAATDADGRFDVRLARDEAYGFLAAQAPGYARRSGRLVPRLPYDPTPTEMEYAFELAAGSGTITGTVVDESAAPVAGAVVGGPWLRPVGSSPQDEFAGCAISISDAQGRFALDALPEGRAFVVAVRAGGFLAAESAEVAVGSETTIVLRRSSASVVGTVLTHDGRPVSNSVVSIEPAESEGLAPADALAATGRTETDADGAFAFPDLPAGRFVIKGSGAFFGECSEQGGLCVELDLAPGRTHAVVLKLPAPFVVAGRVHDVATGNGLAGAVISNEGIGRYRRMPQRESTPGASVRSQADGSFRLEVVPQPNDVAILATELPPGWVATGDFANGNFSVRRDPSVDVVAQDIPVARGVELRGTVVHGGSGAPAPLVNVDVRTHGRVRVADSFSRVVLADADGRFAMWVPPGRSLRVAVRTEEASAEKFVQIPETGTPEPVAIVLEAFASVAGRVTANGEPVEGVRVGATRTDPISGSTNYMADGTTGADGRYRIASLRPGECRVTLTGGDASSRNLRTPEPMVVVLAPGEEAVADFALEWGTVIEGVVADESGAPIEGATIGIWVARDGFGYSSEDFQARTDAEGYYAVGGFAGTEELNSIKASAPGYFDESRPIASVADSPVNFALMANPPVPLFVYAGSPASPVTSYDYRIVTRGTMPNVFIPYRQRDSVHVSSADGRTLLHDVPPGAHRLEIRESLIGTPLPEGDRPNLSERLAALRAAIVDIAVHPGVAPDPVAVDLGAGLELSGRIVDEKGAPWAALSVSLYPPQTSSESWTSEVPAFRAITDAQGEFRFPSVTPGPYRLGASSWTMLAHRDVEVPAAPPVPPVEIVIARTGSIRVLVVGAGFETPPAGIRYEIAPRNDGVGPPQGARLEGTLEFDASQHALVDGIALGDYDIAITLPDGRVRTERFSARPSSTNVPVVRVDFRDTVELTGFVRFDGVPWEGEPQLKLSAKNARLESRGGGAYAVSVFPGKLCLVLGTSNSTIVGSVDVPVGVSTFAHDFDLRLASASVVLDVPAGARLPRGWVNVVALDDTEMCGPTTHASIERESALVESIVPGMRRATYRSYDALWVGASEPATVAAGAVNAFVIPVRRSRNAVRVGAWDTAGMQPGTNALSFDASPAIRGTPTSATVVFEHGEGEGSLEIARIELRSSAGTAARSLSDVVGPTSVSFAAGFGANLPACDSGCTLRIDVVPRGTGTCTGAVYVIAN